MKLNYKKTLKLLTLLLTSILISFVSAATYSELYMKATPITIGAADLKFVNGANTTSIGSVNAAGTEAVFDGMSVDPGQTITYEQAVNITNGAGSTKTLNMSLYSITGNFSTNFDYINVTIIAANGTSLGSNIEIVSSGPNVTSTGNIQMADGELWTVRWIITAKTTATEGQSTSVTLKVKVE